MPSTIRWQPKAKTTPQVDTITIANTWAANDTVTVTINGKALVYTATSGTIADITAGLEAALAASTEGEFTELTYDSTATTVTMTGADDGRPFTATVTESTAGSGTATRSTTTTASSPNDVSLAANYSGGVLPATGDTLYIDQTDISLLWNLSSLSAVTLAALYVKQSFTGFIGLPKYSDNGYTEYRADYLTIGATILEVGEGEGSGSGRIKVNTQAVTTGIQVFATGGPAEGTLPAFIWRGTDNSNTMQVASGSVGVGIFGGEAVQLSSAKFATGTIWLGDDVGGLATLEIGSATVVLNGDVDTLTMFGQGSLRHNSGDVTTSATINAGTYYWLSDGSIDSLTIGGPLGAVLDCSQDGRARTLAASTLLPGATIRDPMSTITYTTNPAIGDRVQQLQVT